MVEMLAKMEELFKSEELEQSAALERLGLELRPLLWDQLEKRLPVQERAEIKRILGAGITEQNTQLQSELRAALQIYAEVQKGNEDLQAELQNLARFRLPETPARDLLKSEISFFLDTITNSSAEVAASVAQTPRDRYLLDYAKNSSSSRPGTALSRPGTSSTSFSQPSSVPSSSYSISGASIYSNAQSSIPSRPATARSMKRPRTADDMLRPLRRYLNVEHIDRAGTRLRSLLEEEKRGLLEDLEYIHHLIGQEAEQTNMLRRKDTAEESELPSEAELRNVKNKLHEKWTSLQQQEEAQERLSTPGPLSGPRRDVLGSHKSKNVDVYDLEQDLYFHQSEADGAEMGAAPTEPKQSEPKLDLSFLGHEDEQFFLEELASVTPVAATAASSASSSTPFSSPASQAMPPPKLRLADALRQSQREVSRLGDISRTKRSLTSPHGASSTSRKAGGSQSSRLRERIETALLFSEQADQQ